MKYQANGPWTGSKSAAFDGSSYLQLPPLNLGILSADNGFSVCVWYLYIALNSWSRIIDFGIGKGHNNCFPAILETTSQLVLNAHDGTTSYQTPLPIYVTLNQWSHICVTNKQSTTNVYDNSQLVFTSTSMVFNNVLLTSNYMGKSNWAVDGLLNGRLDELCIYNVELSFTQVSELYNARPVTGCLSRSFHNFMSHIFIFRIK